jgi:hypothetical protein
MSVILNVYSYSDIRNPDVENYSQSFAKTVNILKNIVNDSSIVQITFVY